MEWILIQTQQELDNHVSSNNRRGSIQIFLPFNRMKHYLARQGSLTRAQAKRYFSSINRTSRASQALTNLHEKRLQHRLSVLSCETIDDPRFDRATAIGRLSWLRMKLLLIIFCRHAILSLFSLLTSTRTWLFLFIFLICSFDSHHMTPKDSNITVFRVIFEVISAFGGCGLSMGHPTVTSSFATVLSVPSKIILILTMCMGRHRGLLDSMKDQEEIEYSAQTLIDSWKQLAVFEQIEKRKSSVIQSPQQRLSSIRSIERNPSFVTRF